MPQEVVRFTKSWIDRLSPAEDPANPPTYIDEIFRPLRLSVGKRRKTFSVNCNRAGRRKNVTLGYSDDITVEEARNKARSVYAQFKDDGVVVDRRRSDVTLRDALDLLYGLPSHQLSEGMKYEYRNHAELYLADWLDIPLRSFTPEMLRKRHEDINEQRTMPRPCRRKKHQPKGSKSPYAANWMLRTFKRAYNLALNEWHDLPLPRNPVAAVQKNPEPPRAQVATAPADFARLWASIQARPNPVRRAHYVFRLYTGLRGPSAKMLRWDDLDFDQMTILVRRTKIGRSFYVPMSPQIVSFLSPLPRTSPFVFAAPTKTGYIAEDRDDELTHTPGELRHLFRAAALHARVPEDRVELLMHHRVSSTTSRGYLSEGWRALAEDQAAISAWLDRACRDPRGQS